MQILLSTYSQQREFAVGVPHFGRSGWQHDYSDVVGYFIQSMVVVADLEPDNATAAATARSSPTQQQAGHAGGASLATLLQRVKASMLAAMQHSQAPFPAVVAELHRRDPSSRDPSFPPGRVQVGGWAARVGLWDPHMASPPCT